MRRALRILSSVLGVLSAAGSEARTWYVKSDGTGDAPTIQAAIDSAASDDSVLVAAGIYDENLDTQGKRLFLMGQAGAEQTIIDGGRRARVLTLSGGGVVEGLTLRNGQAYLGGGVWVGGPVRATLRASIIESNIAGFEFDSGLGGGVFLTSDTPNSLLESNIIRNNVSGTSGGGIYDESSGFAPSQILNNVVTGNACHVGGGGIAASGRVVGNLVANNWSDAFAGGIWTPGSDVLNNTIVGNNSGNGVGEGIFISGGALVSHNIVVRNGTDGNPGTGIACDAPSPPTVTCNDSWGNGIDGFAGCDTTGGQNFTADPLFCNESQESFLLDSRSPCAPLQGSPCGLVGAFGIGCGTNPVERRTWGNVKLLYR